MMSEGTIRHKIRQALFRHRKDYIRTHLDPAPNNCLHNAKMAYPDRDTTIGVCRYQKDGMAKNVVCDECFGGIKQARQCDAFEPMVPAERLKGRFKENIEEAVKDPRAIGHIAKNYPDVAALMWVLGDAPESVLEAFREDDPVPTPVQEEEPMPEDPGDG